jgi:hypothetical protein
MWNRVLDLEISKGKTIALQQKANKNKNKWLHLIGQL